MLHLEMSEELLQTAIDKMLAEVFKPDNYNNPLKDLVHRAVGSGYSRGTLTAQIEEKIVVKITAMMETPEFDAMLGQAVAKAIAEREVKKKI